MATAPRVVFEDHLPEFFTVEGGPFLQRFLAAFEDVFDGLLAEAEGDAGGAGGGIPDLFGVTATPPVEFDHRIGGPDAADDDLDFLGYLAAWVGIPVRRDVLRHGD